MQVIFCSRWFVLSLGGFNWALFLLWEESLVLLEQTLRTIQIWETGGKQRYPHSPWHWSKALTGDSLPLLTLPSGGWPCLAVAWKRLAHAPAQQGGTQHTIYPIFTFWVWNAFLKWVSILGRRCVFLEQQHKTASHSSTCSKFLLLRDDKNEILKSVEWKIHRQNRSLYLHY